MLMGHLMTALGARGQAVHQRFEKRDLLCADDHSRREQVAAEKIGFELDGVQVTIAIATQLKAGGTSARKFGMRWMT